MNWYPSLTSMVYILFFIIRSESLPGNGMGYEWREIEVVPLWFVKYIRTDFYWLILAFDHFFLCRIYVIFISAWRLINIYGMSLANDLTDICRIVGYFYSGEFALLGILVGDGIVWVTMVCVVSYTTKHNYCLTNMLPSCIFIENVTIWYTLIYAIW